MNKIATRCLNSLLSGSKKQFEKLELDKDEDDNPDRFDCLGKLRSLFGDVKKKLSL